MDGIIPICFKVVDWVTSSSLIAAAGVTKCKALAVSNYFRSAAVKIISAKQRIRAAVLN